MMVEVSNDTYHGWLIVEDGVVNKAASLLQFTIGQTYHHVSDALQKNGFKVVVTRTDI